MLSVTMRRPISTFLRSPRTAFLGAALTLATVRCSLVEQTDDLAVPVPDAAPPEPDDAGMNSDDADADAGAPIADANDAAASDAHCQDAGVGPKMVEWTSVQGVSFCIDSTEVTQSQYQQFLFATAGDAATKDPRCAYDVSRIPLGCAPGAYDPATRGDYPVVCVDWCDAKAFCEWNGKRLCGRIGGGVLSLQNSESTDVSKSEWTAACGGNGTHVFPYGNDYNPSACCAADRDGGDGGPWPTGSVPSCTGGAPGTFDMSGNVSEWEDSCVEVDSGSGSEQCTARGGSVANGSGNWGYLTCEARGVSIPVVSRSTHAIDIGFRCCAD